MHSSERAIALILKELEQASGALVESVDIVDVDVTTISDTRQILDRRVSIKLKPVPGTNWLA
jgi:hypothetical protein